MKKKKLAKYVLINLKSLEIIIKLIFSYIFKLIFQILKRSLLKNIKKSQNIFRKRKKPTVHTVKYQKLLRQPRR